MNAHVNVVWKVDFEEVVSYSYLVIYELHLCYRLCYALSGLFVNILSLLMVTFWIFNLCNAMICAWNSSYQVLCGQPYTIELTIVLDIKYSSITVIFRSIICDQGSRLSRVKIFTSSMINSCWYGFVWNDKWSISSRLYVHVHPPSPAPLAIWDLRDASTINFYKHRADQPTSKRTATITFPHSLKQARYEGRIHTWAFSSTRLGWIVRLAFWCIWRGRLC